MLYILDGKCVSLYKSSFEQKQTYFRKPLEMALNFEAEGAKAIYLVDLDGLKDNTFRQKDLFLMIAEKITVPVWFETGFNSVDAVGEALSMGCDYAVIRPVATHLVAEAIQRFGGDKVAVLILAKGSKVVGLEKKSYEEGVDVVDYAESLSALGVKTIIYRDEQSEGTLIHPNYDIADRLYQVTGKDLKIYISGGISESRHLKILKNIGITGAMIGKAFYERIISFKEAASAGQ